ncbi:TetR/AcrR family transcriptional regulator [Salinispora vitiensis]|uniref:TetR/AcrR family transcriptional regulator n=1 Tax=Salinispora vitiensis TaxID=999544 RepID=UPI0003755CCB|nr:TetR family transcriptional regulator C-terminal domain-containing protein [Salinispora vitiensis]
MTDGKPANQRRRQLADAVLAIAGERGLDEVSIREVAARTGVSIGAVQYYFRTKDELLLFAIEQVTERLISRLDALPPAASIRAEIHREMAAMMPLNPPAELANRIWLAFAARSLVSESLGEAHATGLRQIRAHYESRLSEARDDGNLSDVDPKMAATILLALVDGLTMHALLSPDELPADFLRRAIDVYLDWIFHVP